MKLRELGEGGLLELVREWVGPARGTVRVSIGDDAAHRAILEELDDVAAGQGSSRS